MEQEVGRLDRNLLKALHMAQKRAILQNIAIFKQKILI